MMNAKDELTDIIKTMGDLDDGIWQLIHREINNGHTFSNDFIEDIGMLTVRSKFYVMKYGENGK